MCACSAPAQERPVFSDDFERDVRGPDWTAQNGSWTILDRALYCVGPGTVTCNRPLPRNVRVEYDCFSREPCDMTLLLCLTGSSHVSGYFFGFGSEGNAKNKILRRKRQIAVDTEHLPEAKRWYHVAVEKRGRFLSMWVDGQKSLSAYDFNEHEMAGREWGFYVWTQAKFDNVRAFELSESSGEEPPEPKPEVQQVFSFENDTVGGPPAGLETVSGKRCSAKVIDFPNVIPQRSSRGPGTEMDRCVELISAGWGSRDLGGVRYRFVPLANGLVEADVMALDEAQNGGRVALLDSDAAVLATFGWDDRGYYHNVGPEGRRDIHCRVEFPHRSVKSLIRHQAGRWLTIRLDFDSEPGEYDAALLNYYRHNGQKGPGSPDSFTNRIPLGSKLPFRHQGQVAGVEITTDSRSRLFVDNLVVYGPTGAYTVNGKDRRFAAADLLGLRFEPRRDPFRLKVLTSRHILTDKGPKREQRNPAYEPFKAAGEEYSRLLVREAKAAEALRGHRRAAYYLELAEHSRLQSSGATGKLALPVPPQGRDHTLKASLRVAPSTLRAALRRAGAACAASEAALEQAYQSFAEAYCQHLDAKRLDEVHQPAIRRLAGSLDAAERANVELADAVYAHAADVSPLPRCAAGGDLRQYVWREGRYELDGVPAHTHSQVSHVVWWQAHRGQEEALELPCLVRGYRGTRGCKPGQLNSPEYFNVHWGKYVETRPHATYELGTGYGAHDIWMVVPEWWLDEHVKKDPDVLFRDRDGKALGLPEGKTWTKLAYMGPTTFLNFWHPEVLKLMYGSARDWGAYMAKQYPRRVKHFTIGAEQVNAVYGNETGHNRTARVAFRQYLKQRYGDDLARLNETWGTSHKSFDEITPPPERAKAPSGAAYEFQRFRQDGYMNWVRTISRGFKETLGSIPSLNYFNITFGGIDRVVGFDLVSLFKTYDVNCYHTFYRPHWFPMCRALDSLRKAYPGHGLGRMEWGASTTCPDLSDERAYLANGLSLQFCDLAWGLTHHALWYGTMHGWSEGCHWTEYRLGNSVLQYSSSFIPLSMERCRALGRPAIEYPTIRPDVGLLEATSSFLNAIPDSLYYLGVRRSMIAAAVTLERLGINYGVLYEEPVLEGRQQLSDCQTIVVPVGVCCPPKLANMLLDYVREGGTLVLIGPCGLYDQYGKPDNRFLGAAFPDAKWNRSGRGWWLSGNRERFVHNAPTYGKFGLMLRERVGQGTLTVFTDLTEMDMDLFSTAVERSIQRTYDLSDREHFQLVVREAPDCWYVYVVNMDWQRTREVQVTLARESTGVFDMGCGKPMSIPRRSYNGVTKLWLRLAPAEGTVLKVATQ